MFYVPHIDYAFDSVEYIMRDIKDGWLIRYIHKTLKTINSVGRVSRLHRESQRFESVITNSFTKTCLGSSVG